MTSDSVKNLVLLRFADLAQLPLGVAENYSHLCASAVEEFIPRLKGVPNELQVEKLRNLFAASAYHRYCCLNMARQQYTQMSLSDVSIRNNLKESCEAALSYKNMLLEDCADILSAVSSPLKTV